MPPKENKKKKAKKAPAYLTSDADLAPFGVKANQLVRNSLGMTGAVLGVRAGALWVRWQGSGLEAPVDGGPVAAAGEAAHIQRTAAELKQEREELEAKWAVYNAEQAKLRAAAEKKKKKKPAVGADAQQQPEGADAATGGALAAAAAAEGSSEGGVPQQEGEAGGAPAGQDW